MAITVGPEAINRASVTVAGNTVIDLANPANASGLITQVDVYVASQITSAKIGIFYLVSGSTYHCRSSYTTGVLPVGLNQLTGLSLAVTAGDFIGIYHATGTVDRANSGGTSAYKSGDYADAGDEAAFTTASQTRIISVHGTGVSGNPWYAYAQQ